MVTKIVLNKIASYSQKVEIEPSGINYIYGSNGTGKTTISNVLANNSDYQHSSVEWDLNNPVHTVVYNKMFVDQNFGQSKSIKGIFTLGKGSVDAYKSIEEAKSCIENTENHIRSLEKGIRENSDKIKEKKRKAIEKCWIVKTKYKDIFAPAYKGSIGSGEIFLEKCIAEKHSNQSQLFDESVIKLKCSSVFNNSLNFIDELATFEYNDLSNIETTNILSNIIIGKNDLQVSLLITRLKNSDWVHNGLKYMHESDGLCPFCQESLKDNFSTDIENFFNETYLNQCKEIETFKTTYVTYVNEKIEQIRDILRRQIPIIDSNILIPHVQLLKEKVKTNILEIDKKIASPSLPITLESLLPFFDTIKSVIDDFSRTIKENNDICNNKNKEQNQLKAEIWRFMVEELEDTLDSYINETDKLLSVNLLLESKLNQDKAQLHAHRVSIKGWESQVSNTSHTINEINGILKLFSFTSFRLAQATEIGFYKIIREDGSEAHETLSEGEYRFITFLYFYHLIKGSVSDTNIMVDKVVVIDDPISSLDSSVLFVVSNLIKNVILECKEAKGSIKQVFVLTHNVYFFKEVTFRGGKRSSQWKEETFWVVKKSDNKSRIEKHYKNPIKTSYELLWKEIQDIENVSNVTIFNTLRRILEYYFNTIGGMDYEACICQFEGEEQLICKSLLSWINDGSHTIGDDLVFHVENEQVEKYLNVFKLVFDKMNHIGHYEMMMIPR